MTSNPPKPDPTVDQIAARLRAGELSPTQALDALIELTLDAELGDHHPVRGQVRNFLRDLVESDPSLARRAERLRAFESSDDLGAPCPPAASTDKEPVR